MKYNCAELEIAAGNTILWYRKIADRKYPDKNISDG